MSAASSVLIFCALVALSYSASLEKDDDLQPQQIHLSLSEDKRNMVVTWTTFKLTRTLVEYGLKSTELVHKVVGSATQFPLTTDKSRIEWIHNAEMTNLPPDSVIYYRVGNHSWSDIFWFKTFPDKTDWVPRIALYGDLGYDYAQSVPLIKKEVQERTLDMIIHAGDFAYDLQNNQGKMGDNFMNLIQPIAAHMPYMTCNGNHEGYNNFSHYKARFEMPGDPGNQNMFFSFNVGPVHFVSISTECYYFRSECVDQVGLQYTWLEKDLKMANLPENREKQPWIVIFGHRPMYCSNSDNDDCTKHNTATRVGIPSLKLPGLEELIYESKVDLAIWAHEHSYERLWPIYNTKVLNGSLEEPYTNPKAPVHIITGTAGCRERHDPFGPYQPWTAFQSSDYGYTKMEALNVTHLHLWQISADKDGKTVDDVWIIKDKYGPYHDYY